MVGPGFTAQTVAQQDALRERIRARLGLSLDDVWLSISFTEDPRWV